MVYAVAMSSAAPPDENASPTGRRADPRARIFLPAHLETLGGRQAAELRSVSRAGAMAAVTTLPKVGSDLVLTCGAIEVFCNVVWAHDGLCGLRFDEPISDEAVLSARHISDHFPERQEEQRRAAARDWAQGGARDGVGS